MLITLGIIGVVAALTMPSLIAKHKKYVYSVKLKSAYSQLSQAIRLSEVNNGPIETWEIYPFDNYVDGVYNAEKEGAHCYDFFIKYLAPYLKYTSESVKKNFNFRLVNNVQVGMNNSASIYLYIKIKPGSNKGGVDVFHFKISSNGLVPVLSNEISDREVLKTRCKSSVIHCTRLIQLDGWEFKPDYPYKL